MATRNRDFVFLGLAIAFLIFSIVMVKHQTAAFAPKYAPPLPAEGTTTAPITLAMGTDLKPLGPGEKPLRNPFALPAAAAHVKLTAPPPPLGQPKPAPAEPVAPVGAQTPAPMPAAPTPAPGTTPAVAEASLPPLMFSAPAKAQSGPVLVGVMNGSSARPDRGDPRGDAPIQRQAWGQSRRALYRTVREQSAGGTGQRAKQADPQDGRELRTP